MRRHFKVAGGVGKEFRATNGILQGCPLSVVLLSLLVASWCRAVATETGAMPEAYADNTGVVGPSKEVEKAGKVTSTYCELTGQELNVKKCAAFLVNCGNARPPRLKGQAGQGELEVKLVSAIRCLGADIRFDPQGQGQRACHKAGGIAIETAHRIAVLPLPTDVRVRMLATQSCASAFHGAEVTQWPKSLVNRFCMKVMAGVWGTSRVNRCKEVVLTVLVPGYRLDPLQALSYHILAGLVRMVQRRPDLHPLIRRVYLLMKDQMAQGPIGIARDALNTIGWSWEYPYGG